LGRISKTKIVAFTGWNNSASHAPTRLPRSEGPHVPRKSRRRSRIANMQVTARAV
jgi:hypothetical protein